MAQAAEQTFGKARLRGMEEGAWAALGPAPHPAPEALAGPQAHAVEPAGGVAPSLAVEEQQQSALEQQRQDEHMAEVERGSPGSHDGGGPSSQDAPEGSWPDRPERQPILELPDGLPGQPQTGPKYK